MIGTGSRGTYLLKHLKDIDNGRCVALCDINQDALDEAAKTIGNNPKTFKDYRELLAQKDVDAVFVTMPLFVHYPITKDALQAGKHVFCEKCLVFKPEEVHGLRALAAEHPKQILQTGLQRRYSYFYQTVKQMVDKGILGDVHAHSRAVAPQHDQQAEPAVDHEAGRREQHRELARVPLDVGRADGGVDVAPGGRGGLDVRVVAGVRDGARQPRHVEGRPRRLRQHPTDLQVPEAARSSRTPRSAPTSFLPYFNGQRVGDGRDHHGHRGHDRDHGGRRSEPYEPKGSPASRGGIASLRRR